MRDTAKGPAAGYIYQFELALVELARMSNTNVLSIEKMDDLAMQNSKGHYIVTIQAKHSISATGSNFGNTSVDLWKTIVNWVEKIKNGQVEKGNHFKAVTNSKIPSNSIIRKFGNSDFHMIIDEIKAIKSRQKKKIKSNKAQGKNSPSMEATLIRIEKVLNNLQYFKIIISNFSFEENYKIKADFFDSIQLGSISSSEYKNNLYESFLGWIISVASENWNDRKAANFTKHDFEEKNYHLLKIHPLKRAILRNKREIPEYATIDLSLTREDIYFQQILDIDRDSEDKEEILKNATIDFILSEIEISHLISKSNSFTKPDYQDLKNECYNAWRKVKMKHAPLDANRYSETDQNDIAIKIFHEIMHEIKINIIDDFSLYSPDNYIQNGTFLQLSDEPVIGWIPSWKEKYKK